MSQSALILEILSSYLDRSQQNSISYNQLIPYMERYMLERPEQESEIQGLMRNNMNLLGANLETLENAGTLQIVRKDGLPLALVYPAYFFSKITRYYARIEDYAELPFPLENSLAISIPDVISQTLDIKSDFMLWLSRENNYPNTVLKINFPDGIASMICSLDTLKNRVLLGAVHKIRHYLRDPKNLAYTRQKLTPTLKGRDLAVKDMLHSIVTTPETACNAIMEPSDFSFHLWTQLSSNLIKEFSQKVDKLSEEHGFCQAAYLIGYYNVYNRGIVQKKKEEESAVNYLFQAMRKSPFAYRISEIYDIKDDKGIPISRRLDKDQINNVVKDRLVSQDKKELPPLLKVNTALSDEQYFILYSSIPQLVAETLLRAQKEMREFYQQSWTIALKQDIQFTTMLDEKIFLDHLHMRLKTHYPVVEALLNYRTLLLASRNDKAQDIHKNELLDIINIAQQSLKPFDEVLRVNRKRILDDAKMHLPAWMVTPVVRNIVRFLRNLFLGSELANKPYASIFDHEAQEAIIKKKSTPEISGKKAEKIARPVSEEDTAGSKTKTNKQQVLQYQEAAKSLEAQFLPPGDNLPRALKEILERWNTNLDEKAKANLETDVNALCRDYLKKMRISSRSKLPQAEDIRAYAVKVWETESLTKIRNRRDLLRYLELYILQLLETMS